MHIKLHKNDCSTPAIHQEIQNAHKYIHFVYVDLQVSASRLMRHDENICFRDFRVLTRATRWVYVELLSDKSANSATDFLTRLIEKAPFRTTKLVQSCYR